MPTDHCMTSKEYYRPLTDSLCYVPNFPHFSNGLCSHD